MDLYQETVLAGDAMALDHLRDAARQLGDLWQLPGMRPDADVGGNRQPQGNGIDDERIAADDAGLLHPPHALGHGG